MLEPERQLEPKGLRRKKKRKKKKWEAKKEYFLQYKKGWALQGFDIDNTAAYHAIEDSKALHASRWQTKEGIYRIKRQALPDVRDAPLHDDNAAASSTDVKPRWRSWDINVIPNGTGQDTYASSWSSTYESFGPLRTFHSFSPPVSPSNDTCRVSFVLVFGLFGLGFVVVGGRLLWRQRSF